MPGVIDYDAEGPIPIEPPVYPFVFRYNPDVPAEGAGGETRSRYEILPNVRVLSVEFFEGARPPLARFRYEFEDPALVPPSVPTSFHQVIGIGSGGRYVVSSGDRIVVRVYDSPSTSWVVFDGFAEVPQVNFSATQDVVTFEAFGTPVRESDEPLKGSVWRDTSRPKFGDDTPTNRPARFNPKGVGNATAEDYDHFAAVRGDREDDPEGWQAALAEFPVFQDPTTRLNAITGGGVEAAMARDWDLAMAARYVLFSPVVNGVAPEDFGKHLRYYEPHRYDAVLNSRRPAVEEVGVDPEDPGTYVDTPIKVNDLDVTGDRRMDALAKLIEPHGFAFRYELGTDDEGDPEWWLKIYRKDDAYPLKPVFLQPEGYAVDPRFTNVEAIGLQRDTQQVVNAWSVDMAPTRYEAAFYLRPLFEVDAADAEPGNLHQWRVGDPSFDPDKYRKFGVDECGEGHWTWSDPDVTTTTDGDFEYDYPATDPQGPNKAVAGRPAPHWLSALVGPDAAPADLPRPGEGKLVAEDAAGERKAAELYVVTSTYAVTDANAGVAVPDWDSVANLWDPEFTQIQKVTKGGWELLPDRLGIRLTRPDVEAWTISEPGKVGDPFPSGSVRVVTSLADPSSGGATTKRFVFLLVTVISDDGTQVGVADRRETSPSKYQARRRLDARGWFQNDGVHRSSPHAPTLDPGLGVTVVALRDDYAAAKAQAEALRKADEVGSVAGAFTVPSFSLAYAVGDRILGVEGRTVSFRQNHRVKGEAGIYPAVVSVRWEFDGRQETVVNLNDRRADPPPERRR